MIDTPQPSQPMAAFSMALRNCLCSHVDYLYMTDLCLSKCFEELTDLQQSVNEGVEGVHVSQTNPIKESCTNNGWWRHLVAGGAAGAISRTCTAPLDRLKCMLMVYGSQTNNLRFSSIVGHMLEEGGIKSFWRGNAINVVKVVPEMALKFMIYEQIKCVLKSGQSKRDLGIADRFLAGSIAGALAQSVIYPLEVLKTKLVIRRTGQYKGIVDCARSLWHKERLKGFYRGYVPNILGIIPYAGIDLAVYETLKKYYSDHHSNDVKPGTVVLLACGIVSSSCGQLASYPLSLVRTRLQANVTIDGRSSDSSTMVGTFRSILISDGLAGLYRGLAINFVKVAPAVSLSYVVYEKTRCLLGVSMT